MGVFDRLGNVIKGAVSARLSNLEKNNPEAVFAAAKEEGITRLKTLESALADLVRRRDAARRAVEEKERESAQLSQALDPEREEEALQILTQRQALETQIATLKTEVELYESKLAEGRASHEAMKESITALGKERDELLVRKANAEARIKAQETLSGFSEDADVRALANVREHIDQLARNADPGMVDSEGRSVRPALARLDAKTKEANARAQLEAMKAARNKREDPPLAIVESPPEGEEPEEPTPPPEKEIKRTL
jgi:phage shock protein A